MTAEQYKLGGDLNYIIEMMKNETDPDKLEELKMQIREMLGTTPYMSIRQDPVRKAADGGFMETLKDKFSKFIDKLESDEPRFFAGQPLNEAAENDPRYQANLAKKVYRDLGYSDEEIDEIVKKKAGDFLELGKYLNQIESLNKAEGGIVHLAPGGSVRAPSTYDKAYEDFLKDIGFTKVDEKTGKVRGSKGAFNKYLTDKGIKIGSAEATAELNNLLKKAGKRPYISVDMSQKGLGQGLIDEITGTEAGKPNVRDIRQSTANKIEEIRLDANDKFGRNPTKKKYEFIKDQITKFFPKVAGTTALLNFISGRALGAASAFMPTEMGDAELYDQEGIMKLMNTEGK